MVSSIDISWFSAYLCDHTQNVSQPHWRSWQSSNVTPAAQRHRYFSRIIFGPSPLLHFCERSKRVWRGYASRPICGRHPSFGQWQNIRNSHNHISNGEGISSTRPLVSNKWTQSQHHKNATDDAGQWAALKICALWTTSKLNSGITNYYSPSQKPKI